MALSLANNIPALTAQQNLNRSSNSLARSLERLSSGIKINRGADGPAALVISEQQRSQISGLQTALDNTSKAVSLVQTAEGALNEINSLLTKVRSLALDSANTGVNDANTLAANQAEVVNALATVDRIAATTQFGSRKVLDGSAGFNGSTDTGNTLFLKATTSSTTGTFAVNVATAAEKGFVAASTAQTAALAADETLTINGVQIALKAGQSQAQVITAINGFSGQTGVTADNGGAGGALRLITTQYGSSARVTAQSTVAAATTSSGLGTTTLTDTGVDIVGTIGLQAATGVGNVLTGTAGLATGISLQVTGTGGSATNTVSGAQGNVSVTDNSLVFQIGANSNQSVKVAIDRVTTGSLGLGVVGNLFGSLAQIDVRTAAGANDAIKVIDQAVSDISTLRGRLGAFQQQTLESNASNLRTTLENTVAAESVIRDTDFATETANFAKSQVLVQAGVTVLSNANQTAQQVLGLLRQ